MRGSSFDPEEARRAWRQVARMRGRALGGRSDAPRVSAQKIVIGILVAVLAVVGLAQFAGDDDEPAKVQVAALPTMGSDTRATTPAPSSPAAPQWATKRDPTASPDPEPVPARSNGATPTTTNGPSNRTATPRRTMADVAFERLAERPIPQGTGTLTAKAFSRIPLSRYDRAPVGAIATTGLHVDRIAVGSGYEDSRCQGSNDGFTVARDEEVHVCLRVVHLRQAEKLVVRWEKDGKLVRRTRVPIPPYHAYRTRAGLRLRKGYEGRWKVRIMTPSGGRELAHASFTIDA